MFNLDAAHPITSGRRDGLAGPDGHAVLERAGTRHSLRFEPIACLSTAAKLSAALRGWALPSDGEVHSFTNEHAGKIEHVVRMLCGMTERITAEQETEAIIGTFLQRAVAVEDFTTYGNTAQRYEAAKELRLVDHYLVDKNTGELVIAVSDLQETARRHVGSSLPRGGSTPAWTASDGSATGSKGGPVPASPGATARTQGSTSTAGISAWRRANELSPHRHTFPRPIRRETQARLRARVFHMESRGDVAIPGAAMTRVNYFAYLISPEWKARAEAAKTRAGHRCQLCNSPRKLETHHRTYARLGAELEADLVVLCHDCHSLFHSHRNVEAA